MTTVAAADSRPGANYAPGSALAVATAATVAQANALGTPLGPPASVVEHESPSAALAELLARHQAVPTPDQARAFSELDGLEAPVRQSLTRVIDAFLGAEDATAAAYADADPDELRRLMDQLGVAGAGGGTTSTSEPGEGLHEVDIELLPMLAARLVLLDASATLERALADSGAGASEATPAIPAQTTTTTTTTCTEPAGSVPLVVAIDAADDGKGEANCYDSNYALVVDLGGRDIYRNNGGAGNFGAGAVVDLGSQDDRYVGGYNGSAYAGSGFLYDDGGNETYIGINGGAIAGTAFLYDGWGDDTYTAGGFATNGGSVNGTGMVLDGAGNDSYKATPGSYATNGGAANVLWPPGVGSLVDLGHGTDSYRTGGVNNQSAWAQYEIGNGTGSAAIGLLLDAGGTGDTYTNISIKTNVATTETDDSEVPKGAAGAQIDQCRTGADAGADGYPAEVCAAVTGAVASVSIDDVTLVEGNSGSSTATFTVSMSKPWPVPVEVDYASSDVTATASGSDYTPVSGTLAFAPNEISKTISATVAGDTVVEDNESFTVVLTQVRGATIAKGRGQGTILNDDAPALWVNDMSSSEGDSDTKAFNLTVTLSVPTTKAVSLNYSTADGTAAAPGDYAAASGTLSLAPGTTTATIPVMVKGDTVIEDNEWFFVNLSGVTNATVAKGQAKATVLNDDA